VQAPGPMEGEWWFVNQHTGGTWKRLASVAAIAGLLASACSSAATTAPTAAPPSQGGAESAAPASAAPASEAPASAAAASEAAGSLAGQSVTVIGTWGGSEQDAFLAMVKPWEQQTGATVKYTGTRDLNAVLTTGVASGVLPDLAGLPGPGQMAEYAKQGSLQDLGSVIDVNTYKSETSPGLVDAGTVNGQLVGVFIKTAIKGLIWYDPKVNDFSANPPTTWDALQQAITANASKADKPWCLGVENGAASGWAGTDWIEDFVLREAGPDVYNQWWQGKIKWSDPQIKKAWQDFGQIVANSYGGSNTVLTTGFANAGDPIFKTPPGCLFLHQASFITGLDNKFKSSKAGVDYNFFPFPDINTQFTGAVEGSGDLFGMFHNTPAAASLMKYLVTAAAQDIWVKIGGAISANKNATDYPDDISKRSAELLANAKIFAFDASDLMPSAMNTAFWSAILDYVKNPGNLDSILANLDKVQTDAYAAQ
jgi:alpha-glucoside transport system substrate-binding protein